MQKENDVLTINAVRDQVLVKSIKPAYKCSVRCHNDKSASALHWPVHVRGSSNIFETFSFPR